MTDERILPTSIKLKPEMKAIIDAYMLFHPGKTFQQIFEQMADEFFKAYPLSNEQKRIVNELLAERQRISPSYPDRKDRHKSRTKKPKKAPPKSADRQQ